MTEPPPPPAPVSAAERIPLLDVLRGFALFGVLLANMVPWFSGRAFLPREEVRAATSGVDEAALFVMGALIHGRSQTLLTLLFGIGFSILLSRAEARGASGARIFLRRVAAMIALGWIHIVALWWGDVVWGYGVAAIFLLPLRRLPRAALLVSAVILTFVPRFVITIPAVEALIASHVPHGNDGGAFKALVLAAIRGHDHGALVRAQAEYAIVFVAPFAAWYLPWLVGRFLVGHAAGQGPWFRDPAAHQPFFRKLLAWSAGLGVAGTALHLAAGAPRRSAAHLSPAVRMALALPEELGTFGLACAYAAAIAILIQRPAWRRSLILLAPAGRAALTTYFSQSLICTFIFYGWGLGMLGKVGAAACVPIAIGVFAAQVIAARLWLDRFRFGPAEWVLRSIVYGKLQPMRVEARPPAGQASG